MLILHFASSNNGVTKFSKKCSFKPKIRKFLKMKNGNRAISIAVLSIIVNACLCLQFHIVYKVAVWHSRFCLKIRCKDSESLEKNRRVLSWLTTIVFRWSYHHSLLSTGIFMMKFYYQTLFVRGVIHPSGHWACRSDKTVIMLDIVHKGCGAGRKR